MRYHTLKTLDAMRIRNTKLKGNNNNNTDISTVQNNNSKIMITDTDILDWANQLVAKSIHPICANLGITNIKSMRDPTITHSLFLLNLLHNINNEVVDCKYISIYT